MYRTRIFVDFWNFSLNWRERASQAGAIQVDWTKLPGAIIRRSEELITATDKGSSLGLDETLVYASIDPAADSKLKNWLDNWLDRQPSFRVTTKERHLRDFKLHCRSCGEYCEDCPKCGEKFRRAVEKGVDTAIVTDLLSLAWQSAFDVAVLVSSDADFVPGVMRVQEKGLKVINASWAKHGFELGKTCWASFDLEDIVNDITRVAPPPAAGGSPQPSTTPRRLPRVPTRL